MQKGDLEHFHRAIYLNLIIKLMFTLVYATKYNINKKLLLNEGRLYKNAENGSNTERAASQIYRQNLAEPFIVKRLWI